MGGGASGAAGAFTSASVMPTLTNLIEGTGLPDPIKQMIGMVASTTLGSLVGGTAGAATAFNVDTNNRQLGSAQQKRLQLLAGGSAEKEARYTKFSVNINDADANRCADLESAGFLLKRDSVFIYDKPNKVLKVYVPADRRIAIAATYFFDDGSMRSSCGPLLRTFASHMGGSYKVKMNYAAKACFLTVQEIDKSGAAIPVPSQSNPACSR